MCITSETCRANSVIKTALNNLHQAGPNKTHILNNLHVPIVRKSGSLYILESSGPVQASNGIAL